MTGLILCGGQSSRMGTDKGLLADSGNTWVETACNKLASVISPVAISINQQQEPSYLSVFPYRQLIVDNDQLSVGGPLRGLLSAHMLMPEETIFLFACDLLFMEPIVFTELIIQQQQNPDSEAYVFTQRQEAEPLCGIYTSTGLAKILAAYHTGTLGKQSMKHILETLNTAYLPLPDEWQTYFKNINTRHDLNS
jgi:molybdopterin-guanine dinucleotide biosynthesis protein A